MCQAKDGTKGLVAASCCSIGPDDQAGGHVPTTGAKRKAEGERLGATGPQQEMVTAPNAPKRPRSAYVLFSSSIREAVTNEALAKDQLAALSSESLGQSDSAVQMEQQAVPVDQQQLSFVPAAVSSQTVMKELAARWSNLSAEEKAEWQAKAMEDKERYNKEVENFDGPLQVREKHPSIGSCVLIGAQRRRRVLEFLCTQRRSNLSYGAYDDIIS